MKKNSITRITKAEAEKLRGKTDWKRLKAMKEEEIDLSDIPELDASFWRNAKFIIPSPKKQKMTAIKLENDLVEWFKKQDKSYVNHIQAVLRTYIVSRP